MKIPTIFASTSRLIFRLAWAIIEAAQPLSPRIIIEVPETLAPPAVSPALAFAGGRPCC